MNKKESKENSTSPKEKEKLKQRLLRLMRQHELKQKKKRSKNVEDDAKEEQSQQHVSNGHVDSKQKQKSKKGKQQERNTLGGGQILTNGMSEKVGNKTKKNLKEFHNTPETTHVSPTINEEEYQTGKYGKKAMEPKSVQNKNSENHKEGASHKPNNSMKKNKNKTKPKNDNTTNPSKHNVIGVSSAEEATTTSSSPKAPLVKDQQKINKSKKNKLKNSTNNDETKNLPPSKEKEDTSKQSEPQENVQKLMSKNKKKQKNSLKINSSKHNDTPAQELPQNHTPKVPLTKNQKKNAKKRAAAAVINSTANDTKKPKLAQEKIQTQKATTKSKKTKKKKDHNQTFSSSLATSGSDVDEYDVNQMSGFVNGGDFADTDCDYAGDSYWKQQYSTNYNDTEESDDESDGDYGYNAALEEHKIAGETTDDDDDNNVSGDDPYNYSGLEEFESDEDDPYNYSDLSEDEEEESEEHYSDFDENDYEEDEDSYDYSDDSEFSSSFEEEEDSGKSYDFNDEEHDEDYKLPDDVPEDLLVHSGTATKRDLLPEDNVQFKDKKYLQIIELKEQNIVKVVQQPSAYKKEELMKLTYKENHRVDLASKNTSNMETNDQDGESLKSNVSSETGNSSSTCPKLVPIVDDDGFQLYNHNASDEEDLEVNEGEEEEYSYEYADDSSMENESLGSEYSEINSEDADSLNSDDINEKYLNRRTDNECYSSDEEYNLRRYASRQTVDIVDASKCVYAGAKCGSKRKTYDDMDNEEGDLNQLPSQKLNKLIRVGSKGRLIITTVVEKLCNEEEEEKEDCCEAAVALQDEEMKEASVADDSKSHLLLDQNSIESSSEISNETIANVNEMDVNTPEHSQTHTKQTARKQTNQSLADYKTIFCNAINANLVLVLLKDPFYIYGTVRLTLLAGKVDVYGHALEVNKEVEIFSPRGCSVIEISPSSSTENESNSKETLQKQVKSLEIDFLLSDLEKIANSYEAGMDAVVLMKRNEERKKVVQQFTKFMNENVFPNLQNINMDRPLYNSEYLLRCLINTSAMEQKCLRLPEQWQRLEVTQKSRVLLAGGKGVGKSTLLRYLINKQLPKSPKVLLIDLDIGQPEVFVPQTVSCSLVDRPLLGPGFFLNIQPEKSFAVGHTNIAMCPHLYVTAVQQLIEYSLNCKEFKNIPWFVNTMGYNKGFGLELLSVIAKALPLTDVIQLQSNKAVNNFESLLFPHVVEQVPRLMFVEHQDSAESEPPPNKLSYRAHIWQAAVQQESRYQKEWDMSPKDIRYAMLLTRLSVALQGPAHFLTDCKPLSASLDQLKLVNLTDDIPPSSNDELAKAMEANIVYLCHCNNEQKSLECLGIGVVRAIDYHVRQIYLVPALATTTLLKDVNCLALGDMPLPSTMFTNQGSRVHKTAPFVYNTIEANASKAIKQIYHRPKAFLSGKHKSLD